VNSFVFLARSKFFDGVTFHRVLEGFMAQTGDPSGTGLGGPGYACNDEIDGSLVFDQPGVLAMANSGANTNGSQFFITFAPRPELYGKYTIFGRVASGQDVVGKITLRDPQNPSAPGGDVIQSVTIQEK
jgi:cyclophilin family peptidyl-prolyl cis-trans isomerase